MSRKLRIPLAVVVALAAGPVYAGTIHVTSLTDRAIPDPLAAGCTLREAMQAHFLGATYQHCTGASGAGDTIVFDSTGTITISFGQLDTATNLTIDGTGQTVSVGCGSAASSKLFIQQAGTSFSLANLQIGPCTAAGSGIGITSTNVTSLNLTNVTVLQVQSNSGGVGGAINLDGGSLSILDSFFTSNATSGTGNGGAIAISNVTAPANAVSITNTIFTTNTAGKNGGAIYISNSLNSIAAISLVNCIFNTNVASGSSSQDGGGAIWAQTQSGVGSVFAITRGKFNANVAQKGAGGAILMALDSRLAYASSLAPSVGGIYASSFDLNVAMGSAGSADGSGGAIFSRGNLTVVQSSFTNNKSLHSSGGALATNMSSTYSTTLANVTFSSNTADQNGGALAKYDADNWTLINDTIAGNTANAIGSTVGGSVWIGAGGAASVNATNTIFSSPSGTGGNCQGTVTDGGHNLQNPGTGCNATITVGDPLLGAATIHAGPNIFVWTMDPAATSPALDHGDNTACNAAPILRFDATGRVAIRPASPGPPNCDIGAYESANAFPVELQKFKIE